MGGSVSRFASLQKLITAIEQNVLNGYEWQWNEEEKNQFFEKLKKEMVLYREIKFGFVVRNIDEKQIEIIEGQIKLESNIRLFECKIEKKLYV